MTSFICLSFHCAFLSISAICTLRAEAYSTRWLVWSFMLSTAELLPPVWLGWYCFQLCLFVCVCLRDNSWTVKPNTHRRRRRDETVESRRVGGVYTNSQLVGDSFVVSSVWTQPSAVVTDTAALCVRIVESVGSRREFMYTPLTPAQRDSTVSSRRRRRCVLSFSKLCRHSHTWHTSAVLTVSMNLSALCTNSGCQLS